MTEKREAAFPAGIPADRYQVELRGHSYYVVNTATGGIMGGPFRSREPAQQRADMLNLTLQEASWLTTT